MSTTRKKQVVIDGAEFIVGSLSMAYVEEFIKWKPEGKTNEEKVARAYDLVGTSLNSAGFDGGDWDTEKIKRQIDLVCFDQLQGEILEFNRLKALPQVPPTGEDKAAQ